RCSIAPVLRRRALHSFPTRRSSDLASQMKLGAAAQAKSRTFFALNRHVRVGLRPEDRGRVKDWPTSAFAMMGTVVSDLSAVARRDRKSTRLNSSHGSNSYAVFCLNK